MRLERAWIGNKGKPVETSAGKRYQVRWLLDPGGGRLPVERKRSTFRTKGEAQLFLERLQQAEYKVNGWTFDRDGQPVEAAALSVTFLSAITQYVISRWSTDWKPAQRTKVRGRLLQLVCLTVDRPGDRRALLEGLESQRNDRGQRPEPQTRAEWAARWLRDHGLLPDAPEATDPRLLDGLRFLEAASVPVSALDHKLVSELQRHFAGSGSQNTARTYWSGTIVPFIKWLCDTEQVTGKPLAGVKKIRRDVEAERPDRDQVPDPNQVRALAADMGHHRHSRIWEIWVLVLAFCALRPSEALGVKLNQFYKDARGRWRLEPDAQETRRVSWATDDGNTQHRTTTKSGRDATPPKRGIPVPAFLAHMLEEEYGEDLGRADRHAFVGPRGGVGNLATVEQWFKDSVRRVFADVPQLSAMTPHFLRHAGMTYWFAAGMDHKKVQMWGGWRSLKEMLDTYRGVLASLEDEQLDGLDDFHDRWASDDSNDADGNGPTTDEAADDGSTILESEADGAAADMPYPRNSTEADAGGDLAGVVDLTAWREARHRAARANER